MNEAQDLVDSLAGRVGRPVGLDDRRFRAIAYSAHTDDVDEVRRASILGRQAPERVVEWLCDLGLMQARDIVHVPANLELAMVARVCVPVRFHDHLLGFVWLLEDDRPLTASELDICRAGAAEIAQELYRLRQQTNEERRLEATWVRAVVRRQTGAGPTIGAGIAADRYYAAMIVEVGLLPGSAPPIGVSVRLTEAVDQLRRSISPRHQMAAVDGARAMVIVAAGTPVDIERHAAALQAAAQAELADLAHTQVRVAVGDPTASLEELVSSAAGAEKAMRLGRSMPELGALVKWSELGGATRLLIELVGDRDPMTLLPVPVKRLLADRDGEELAITLEVYLEHGGDAPAAAAELFIHRSTLYNRLSRIGALARVDIRSGADRLELHLGLRLWRLGAATPAAPSLTRHSMRQRRGGATVSFTSPVK